MSFSIFGGNFSKPGPGVEKDEPPKKGVFRFFEIIVRDFWDLCKLNLIFIASFIPAAVLFYLSASLNSLALFFLALALFCICFGPCSLALNAVTMKINRDIPCYVFYEYKKTIIDEYKKALIVGILEALSTSLMVVAIIQYINLMQSGTLFLVLLSLSFSFLFIMIAAFHTTYLQLNLLDLPLIPMLKNAVLLTFSFLPRVVVAVIICGFVTLAVVIFFPFSIIAVVAFYFSLISLLANMWAFPALKKVFIDKEHTNEN